MSTGPVVCVVDDDESVREALVGLLLSLGLSVAAFESAEQFLASDVLSRTVCLILDVTLGGMSGIALQEKLLSDAAPPPPIVFITAREDARDRDQVLARGALAYLVKPFDESLLLSALRRAPGVQLEDGV